MEKVSIAYPSIAGKKVQPPSKLLNYFLLCSILSKSCCIKTVWNVFSVFRSYSFQFIVFDSFGVIFFSHHVVFGYDG